MWDEKAEYATFLFALMTILLLYNSSGKLYLGLVDSN